MTQSLAAFLTEQDYQFIYQLVKHRENSGLTQLDVAERLGLPLSWIQNFEEIQGYPNLVEIRHYAYAIGAAYYHKVVEASNGESNE